MNPNEPDGRIPVCKVSDIPLPPNGLRFFWHRGDRHIHCFVVMTNGCPEGYVNECAHRQLELDWNPGKFFDLEQRFLVCSTHGALFDPVSGACLSGPCVGNSLHKLDLQTDDEQVFLQGTGSIVLEST